MLSTVPPRSSTRRSLAFSAAGFVARMPHLDDRHRHRDHAVHARAAATAWPGRSRPRCALSAASRPAGLAPGRPLRADAGCSLPATGVDRRSRSGCCCSAPALRRARPGRLLRAPRGGRAACPAWARWCGPAGRGSHRGRRCCTPPTRCESVVDEIVFIIGPILSVGLCTAGSPRPALRGDAAAWPPGCCCSPPSGGPSPRCTRAAGERGRSALRAPGAVGAGGRPSWASGTIFGSVDVVDRGLRRPPAATRRCPAWCSRSTRSAPASPGSSSGRCACTGRCPGGSCWASAMAVSMMPAPTGAEPVVLARGAVRLRPVHLSHDGHRDGPGGTARSRAAKLTEGMTWTTTGLAVGVALGSSPAGRVVDASARLRGLRGAGCARRLRPRSRRSSGHAGSDRYRNSRSVRMSTTTSGSTEPG